MMKKTLWASYLEGLGKRTPGESYSEILRYFWPEFVTALVTSSLVILVDARFIASIVSTTAYATMAISKPILHCLTKISEGLAVGTMVLCGISHGRDDHEGVKKSLASGALVTSIFGGAIALILFFGAESIYRFLGAADTLIAPGVSFLRLRAIGVFLMFFFSSLIGFFRGIKHNDIVMRCYIVGTLLFIITDYVLIFGKCGFQQWYLQGSAIASIVQYASMICVALYYVFQDAEIVKYIGPWRCEYFKSMLQTCALSWPVMCDKAILAIAKIILIKTIAPMGTAAVSSFGAISDIEMFCFVPAIAYAHVVTFLVSNEMGAGDIEGIKYTIKKVLLLASSSVMVLLVICTMNAEAIIGCFDACQNFSALAVPAFRILSILAIFDVVQVILSGALRGVAQMGTVLWVRTATLFFFCMPVAYIASNIVFQSDFVKFITVYSSFYVSNGLMVLLYVYWLRTDRWRRVSL